MTTALLAKINNTNLLFAGLLKLNSYALAPAVGATSATRNCLTSRRSNNTSSHLQTLFVAKPSILFQDSQLQQTIYRTHYTFQFPRNVIRYRRVTRPKKSNKDDILLNYEQTQFIENLGVTKSWNSWNTCTFYLFIIIIIT